MVQHRCSGRSAWSARLLALASGPLRLSRTEMQHSSKGYTLLDICLRNRGLCRVWPSNFRRERKTTRSATDRKAIANRGRLPPAPAAIVTKTGVYAGYRHSCVTGCGSRVLLDRYATYRNACEPHANGPRTAPPGLDSRRDSGGLIARSWRYARVALVVSGTSTYSGEPDSDDFVRALCGALGLSSILNGLA